MPNIWAHDGTNFQLFASGTETADNALPATTVGMQGGPAIAWFKGKMYAATRDTTGTGTTLDVVERAFDGTMSVVASITSALTTAALDCEATIIAVDDKLYILSISADNTIQLHSSSDGTTWAASVDYTGTFTADTLALLNPLYYKGTIYITLAPNAPSLATDDKGVFGLDLSAGASALIAPVMPAVTGGVDYYTAGVFEDFLYVFRTTDTTGTTGLTKWNGVAQVAHTPTGLPTNITAGRAVFFEMNESAYFVMSGLVEDTVIIYESADGIVWADASETYSAPVLGGDYFVQALIDEGESPGTQRYVYLIFVLKDATPEIIIYRWDGTGGLIHRISSTAAVGSTAGFFQDSIPQAHITVPFTFNSDGSITIAYTLYDENSAAADVEIQYSIDGGGHFQRATKHATSAATESLATLTTGTAHTFKWDAQADTVPGDTQIVINIVANIAA